MTLDDLRLKIEKRLIETDGQLHPHDLADIVAEAKGLGLDEKQIARLVPEVDRGIQWEKIRAERATAAEQEVVEKETREAAERIRLEELEAAPQLLSGLVQSLLARGHARGEEIRAILDRAQGLEQSPHAVARQIKSGMDFAKWAPWPPADLSARTIAELLVSTDWYAPQHYPHQASAVGQPAATATAATSQTAQSAPTAVPPTGQFRPQPPQPAPTVSNTPPTAQRPTPVQQRSVQPSNKRRSWSLFWLLPFAIAIGYYFFLRPYLRDKNAPRYYTIAEDAVLRSEPLSSDENKLETLPYGTELIGYGAEGGWSEVKRDDQKGYVATRLLAEKKDYYLLNSIFGNPEAKEAIPTSRARRALLEYYKDNGIAGDMTGEVKKEIFGTAFPRSDVWMVYAKPADSPRNVVLYPRVVKPRSKNPDFAVLITKQAGGERKALLFSFSDEGDATLEEEQAAPKEGNLTGVSRRKGRGESRYVFSYR